MGPKTLSCVTPLVTSIEPDIVNVNVIHLHSAISIASGVHFLLTIYIALLPKGACDSAGRISNTTHYDWYHYHRMQEYNLLCQPAG